MPAEIFQLNKLHSLFLDYNAISEIPAGIGRLTNLYKLSLQRNRLATVPSAIGRLINLKYLVLSNNMLTELPKEMGTLTKLQILDVSNNRLATIPAEVSKLKPKTRIIMDNNQAFNRPAPLADTPAPPPPAPLPPAPPLAPDTREILLVVEQMPRFPGCENEADLFAKNDCSNNKVKDFISKNMKYPAIARENGVQGTVIITFVVEKDGSLSDIKVVRDIGTGCGQEALRLVNLMQEQGLRWTPGQHQGNTVRVQYNLPVKFKL